MKDPYILGAGAVALFLVGIVTHTDAMIHPTVSGIAYISAGVLAAIYFELVNGGSET